METEASYNSSLKRRDTRNSPFCVMLLGIASMSPTAGRARTAAVLLLALLSVFSFLLSLQWPYTEERVIASIARATGSRVRLRHFRTNFLPRPGCTIEGVEIFRYAPQPIARADKVSVESSWWSLLTFRKRVHHVQTQNLRVHLTFPYPPPVRTDSSEGLGELVIRKFVGDGTTLDVSSSNESSAHFELHQIRLADIGVKNRISYSAVLKIPNPPGRLQSSGTFGPLSSSDHARTPVEGSFELSNASLSGYKGLGGTVNGKGRFSGPLENIHVRGTAEASAFEVNHTGHPVVLRTSYRADVNGLSGDVLFEAIGAEFLRTRLTAYGSVAGKQGKTVSAHFKADQARVEDLLSMFTRSDHPALVGAIQFLADADLLSGDEPFLQRLILRGRFGISDARWTKPSTQTKVDGLSARARGDKRKAEEHTAERVLSQLLGEVSLKDGLASLSGISFHVPGATGTGGGTYNLLTKQVALKGTVSLSADASEAASGFKSVLLKPFDGLFRRNKEKGATLPVSIVGLYPRPEYRIGLKR